MQELARVQHNLDRKNKEGKLETCAMSTSRTKHHRLPPEPTCTLMAVKG